MVGSKSNESILGDNERSLYRPADSKAGLRTSGIQSNPLETGNRPRICVDRSFCGIHTPPNQVRITAVAANSK